MESEFKISVPAILNDASIIRFLEGWKWFVPSQSKVELDFCGCTFLAPWALVLFAVHGLWLATEHNKIVTIHYDQETEVGKYLDNSGFIRLFDDSEETPGSRAGFTVCLEQITGSDQIYPFSRSVTSMLQIDDPEIEGAIEYSLTELLRNVVQHSGSAIGGFAMAQYFPKTGQIELVVADRGVGIRKHISATYPEAETDTLALNLALLPHHSGTFGHAMYGSMKDNAGLGLFFVSEIAVRGGGGYKLCSGTALLNKWRTRLGERKSRPAVFPRSEGWPGTLAVIHLNRGLIGDFEQLLTLCRDLAAESRDDPFLQSLDFVDAVPEEADVEIIAVKDFVENVEEAARVRDMRVIPALHVGKTVVYDFADVRIITQSFAHALLYLILKRQLHVRFSLQLAHCVESVKAAIRVVSSYARRTPDKNG